jgi:hypothetical protein
MRRLPGTLPLGHFSSLLLIPDTRIQLHVRVHPRRPGAAPICERLPLHDREKRSPLRCPRRARAVRHAVPAARALAARLLDLQRIRARPSPKPGLRGQRLIHGLPRDAAGA